VIVATAKAVALHGLDNLSKHIENIRLFNLEPIVAINRFPDDQSAELRRIINHCKGQGVEAIVATHYTDGGAGAMDLAKAVLKVVDARGGKKKLKFLYPMNAPLKKKIEAVAKKVYGASGVDYERAAETHIELLTKRGLANLPVCIAKTNMSLSDDPSLPGRPRNFRITVNELRVSAGAGFVVVIAGNIMTMPGLPKVPAAARIQVDAKGHATGLA